MLATLKGHNYLINLIKFRITLCRNRDKLVISITKRFNANNYAWV